MNNISLKNIVWKEGKYWVAKCLNVEVSSFGKTKKEALCNLNEALELYFEDEPKKVKLLEVKSPQVFDLRLRYA